MRQLIIYLTLILFSSLTLSSQNPSFIWENCEMSASWYRQQATAWELKVKNDPADADAWLNYYKAERFALIASDKPASSSKLDSIESQMKQHLPEHAWTYYVMFWNNRSNPQAFSYLEKAYQLKPSEWRLYDDFVRYYEASGDYSKKAEFLRLWNARHPYSPVVDEMNANLLRATGDDALIISAGYSDTYSLWLYQEKGSFKNRRVVMLSMLVEPTYRARIMKELGMKDPLPGQQVVNEASFLKALLVSNMDQEIYLTLHHNKAILNGLSSYLYITGVSLRFTMQAIDNIPLLLANWKTFRWDELNKLCESESLLRSERILSAYMLPLLTLLEEEEQGEKKARGDDYLNKAQCIARLTGKTKQLERVMQQRE